MSRVDLGRRVDRINDDARSPPLAADSAHTRFTRRPQRTWSIPDKSFSWSLSLHRLYGPNSSTSIQLRVRLSFVRPQRGFLCSFPIRTHGSFSSEYYLEEAYNLTSSFRADFKPAYNTRAASSSAVAVICVLIEIAHALVQQHLHPSENFEDNHTEALKLVFVLGITLQQRLPQNATDTRRYVRRRSMLAVSR